MIEVLPKSRYIQVTFCLSLPVAATREQIEEWVGLALCRSGMDNDNPLAAHDVEAACDPLLHDTELHLHHHVTRTGENGWSTRGSLESEPFHGKTATDMLHEHYAAKPPTPPT